MSVHDKNQMVELFESNMKNFIRGDFSIIVHKLKETPINELSVHTFEDMFDMLVRNIEYVQHSDFLEMYQLYYWKIMGDFNGRKTKSCSNII